MRSVIVIPARYKSSRFPGKPLVLLAGKPMIIWVAELSSKAIGKENVYIATDDTRISEVVTQEGFQVVMTSEKALTGTDRLAEAADKIDADIYINVQGDEPLVAPDDILKVHQKKKEFPNEVICGYNSINKEEADNINVPKVLFAENKQMVYMSRQLVPGFKDIENAPKEYFKQVCIYAFNKKELSDFREFGRKGLLENYEDIELLRFLEWGQAIRMIETAKGSLAIDVPDDVINVELVLQKR